MNIYLIERQGSVSYDEYISAVVQAESEYEARNTHPNGRFNYIEDEFFDMSWIIPEDVVVTYLGKATPSLNKKIVICVNFYSG